MRVFMASETGYRVRSVLADTSVTVHVLAYLPFCYFHSNAWHYLHVQIENLHA